MKAPLLVQMDLLGPAGRSMDAHRLARLAELDQGERPLVLVTERPTRWAPTRSRVDGAFGRQAEVEAELRRAGGNLDAVLYLDLGLFSRRGQLRDSLADLANRYAVELSDVQAVMSAGRLAEALRDLIGGVTIVSDEEAFDAALKEARR